MANAHVHLEQARHNEVLRSSIPDTHPDWELTVIFYSALHYVRSFLSGRSVGYSADDLRYDMLGHFLKLEREPQIAHNFDILRNLSYDSRYKCRSMSWAFQQMTVAERALKALKTRVGELGVSH